MNVVPRVEWVGPYKLTVSHLSYRGGRGDRWFWTCVDTRDTSRRRSMRASDEAWAIADARKAAATLERELEAAKRCTICALPLEGDEPWRFFGASPAHTTCWTGERYGEDAA